MTKTLLAASVSLLIGIASAQAQNCSSNFTVEGVPLLTAMNYKSWVNFPKLDPKKGLDNVARAVMAEGFQDMRVEKGLGAVTAVQETTGSGRPQTLRIVVRKRGGATRVDAVFAIQSGQVAPEGMTRAAICRVLEAAAD